ncbi:hypothetical protein [Lyngbya confervoides]|uniref:Uncharacterized protein n=1 Tax=Lyngbya confervoides BDU141951 TaxID=1574623 RepID=A0ABD4T9C4_9CYAN|nr:hypothetical protein [Lyngbya confervoides]MCM1985404.1 hypothetical protein [Lyngbya confervoides BDU141951]
MLSEESKQLRFRFYHELEAAFRRICDEVADSDLKEGDIARLAQRIMQARHASLKILVDSDEMDEYFAAYPEAD